MISYPPSLLAIGGARTGIAPVNLLDVLDTNGNCYYWSDRPSNAPVVITGAIAGTIAPAPAPPIPPVAGESVAWAVPSEAAVSNPPAMIDWPYQPQAGLAVAFAATSSANAYGSVGLSLNPNFDENYAAWWGDFALPSPLPSGAVITRIYPVMQASSTVSSGYSYFSFGSGLTPNGAGNFNEPYSDLYALGGSFLLWTGSSLGTSLSVLAGMNIGCGLYAERAGAGSNIVVNFVGFAIYYTLPGGGSSSGSGGGSGSLGGSGYRFAGPYRPWLVGVPQFSFHRSLQTDVGSFVIQNLSGDTLSRDFEKIARRSALEGAMFVFRCWQADAQAAWLEVHGTLTVDEIGVDTVKLKGAQLINPSQDDTPLEIYSETCQLQWGGVRCGATGDTECSYSYQSCQSLARIMVQMNNYETNYGQNVADTALNVINRRRTI